MTTKLTASKRIGAMSDFCINHFGTDHAEDFCAEECSELIQALMKVQRPDISEARRAQAVMNIAEEAAQVIYTLEVVLTKHGMSLSDLDQSVIPKLIKYNVKDPGPYGL